MTRSLVVGAVGCAVVGALLVLAGCSGGDSGRTSPGGSAPRSPGEQRTTEPGQPTTEPGQPTTEPGQRTTEPGEGSTGPDPRPSGTAAPPAEPPGAWDQQIDAMSVPELAHQLLVVTVAGTAPGRVPAGAAAANLADFGVRTPAAVARSFRPGGIVYFDHNVRSVTQVRALSRGIHRASGRSGTPTLLFTDQEGGLVSRLLGPAATSQPAARGLGGDRRAGYVSARRVGAAMAAMGLDVDFAPVADVDTVGGAGVIGDRAFGTTAAAVSPMVAAQTCGYHRGGVGVTLKHWPGHGSTSVDSHRALPTLTLPERTWRHVHVRPFAAGIRRGADLVMTGHLAYPSLDPSGRPASLSRPMTTGWLRDRLGFDGVIITDALEMAAIAGRGTPGQVAVAAVRAGADLLLMSPSPRGAAAGIQQAVAAGQLTRRRLEESVRRVLALKDRVGLVAGPRELQDC